MTCPKDCGYKWKLIGRNLKLIQKCVCNQKIQDKKSEHIIMCTRPKEHQGLHHRHYQRNPKECIRKWTTEEAVIEAL